MAASLFKLAVGGPEFGHLTLTRFFALHAGVFPAILLGLLVLHAWLANAADKKAKKETALTKDAIASESPDAYWPRQALADALACVVVLAVILGLSLQHGVAGPAAGVELGAPADPADAYAAARPEWSFRGLYEFAHLFPARLEVLAIFVIPGLLVVVFLLMPFIGRRRVGYWFNVLFTLTLLVGSIALGWRSLARDAQDADFQRALAAGREQAARAKELARSPQGIPVTGALSLLRSDPKTQGPRLFGQLCASCHAHAEAKDLPAVGSPFTAPNLYGFATRRWLAGLLDPKQIAGPQYFGNTSLKNKDMPKFVKRTMSDLDAAEKRDLEKVIMALSAEAGLKSQRREDARDAKQIKEGRPLLGAAGPFGCTDCHKFRKEGTLGDAPLLTGYGSRDWLIGIISNPAQSRYYGKKNDRMPAYAPSAEATGNVLSQRDIGLLADWLRGEWYEEGEEP